MEPIRVLHMIGSMNIGGSQTMVLNLYRAIDREKVQFDFVLDHSEERALAREFESLGARIFVLPGFNGKNFIQVRKAWDQFFREHPEYKILHSHVRSYASIFIPIAKQFGVKTIIHSHSTSNGRGIQSVVKALLQFPLRYQADVFLSCSQEAGQWLFGKRIAESDRHFILKNAIDAKRYRDSGLTRIEYREDLNIADKAVYVHVGRFHSAKNHSFLLETFRLIRNVQQNAVLLLIGDGELRNEIEEKVRQLGIKEDVVLLGNRHDIPELLQAADVFLFPSLWEGLGIVAVEAQAAGLPCICSDQVPELVKVTENCFFLPFIQEIWVEAALNALGTKCDHAYEAVIEANYDVYSTAQWLQSFYLNV